MVTRKLPFLSLFAREYDGSAIFDASLYVGALFRKSCFG